MQIPKEGQFEADEYKTVDSDNLPEYLTRGWRVLGFAEQSYVQSHPASISFNGHGPNGSVTGSGGFDMPFAVRKTVFILGRDSEKANEEAMVLATNALLAKAKEDAKKTEDKIADLFRDFSDKEDELAAANERCEKEQKEALAAVTAFERLDGEVCKIRKEVGEIRWREILAATETEDILSGDGE